MAKAAATPCPECQRLQAQLDAQRAQLEALQAMVAKLQEQLAAARKNSSTSSKPPSSDIVKPPKTPPAAQDGKRAAGGQPGHPKHERVPFPPEQLTLQVTHTLTACPGCGGPVRPNAHLARVVQQVDLLPTPLTVEQHTCPEYWCVHCRKAYTAALPAHIETGGLVGPRLTTLIAYLKGVCHASFSTVRTFLRDVVGLTISRGQLSKVINKVSAALEPLYGELLADLPNQAHLNVDETSHRNNKEMLWTWCFRADLYTLFRIDPTRSADVLMDVLGQEFDGVLGCDCFSAYRRYMRACGVPLQFCLAHLIREVKFLTTLPDAPTRQYGERFLQALRQLFGVIHRREALSAGVFCSRLAAARAEILRQATERVPASKAAARLAKRMTQYGECYFEFITTPGLEPTNNVAEQAIRFVVIDRHITQGTRSESGQRWCERIWTVIATCAQQGRSVFDDLHRAVVAYFHGAPAPALRAVPEG